MITQATKLLKSKKSVILQGAPGTGKTYATAALALSVLGVTDVDFNDHAAVMRKYEELRGQKRIFLHDVPPVDGLRGFCGGNQAAGGGRAGWVFRRGRDLQECLLGRVELQYYRLHR